MADWPFVGRESELEAVAAVLERPGSGGVVFVGPPGVGKTRLLAECRRVAERVGFACVAITPIPPPASVPFGAVSRFLPSETPTAAAGLLQSAVRAIVEEAAGRPLLLLVDDAHLLDDGSATVVAQLVEAEQAFVAGAVRRGERTPDAVVSLWKDGRARRLDVSPLPFETFTRLAEAALGGPIESATRWRLWKLTGGNPLYLREVVIAASGDGTLRRAGGLWRFAGRVTPTARLRELVGGRLATLATDERQAVELVAFGEPVGVAVVDRLCGPGIAERLERAGLLVVERNGNRVEAHLANALFGEAVRSTTSVVRARRIHRALVEALSGTGARRADDSLRMAASMLELGPVPGAVAVRAARSAADRSDYAMAERFARRAVEDGVGLEATLALGDVLAHQGRFDEAMGVLAAVSDHTDGETMEVAVSRAAVLRMAGRPDEARAVESRALEQDIGDAARRELVASAAWHELLEGPPATALRRVESFLDGAVDRAAIRAAFVAGLALPLLGRADEALTLSERRFGVHVELHEGRGMFPPAMHAVFRALALCHAGRPGDALEEIDTIHRDAIERGGVTTVQAWSAMELARAELLVGNTPEAARLAREGAVLSRDEAQEVASRWCWTLVALAEAMSGDAVAAAEAITAAEAAADGRPWLMDAELERARAWAAAATGDDDAARRWFESAADRSGATGEVALEIGALHDLARHGGAAVASDRLDDVADRVGGVVALACAADARARRDHDPGALERAGARFEAMSLRLHAAESFLAASEAWGGVGERRRATACNRRATTIARSCPGAATPALAALDALRELELTTGEEEVAVLASTGLANRVIADRLCLSVRTVENRLQRAFRKLGVRDRSELAAALHTRNSY